MVKVDRLSASTNVIATMSLLLENLSELQGACRPPLSIFSVLETVLQKLQLHAEAIGALQLKVTSRSMHFGR